MGTPNARPARLAICALSMSLVLLVLISSHGRQSGAQVHRGAEGKTDFGQPAARPSATGDGSVSEILAQLKSLRGRVETLEMREKVLRRQACALAHNVKRLEGLLCGASGMKAKGARGLDIDRVARTGGRPDAKDAMVSMAAMAAVWRQIDAILDKLDEITTALSGAS